MDSVLRALSGKPATHRYRIIPDKQSRKTEVSGFAAIQTRADQIVLKCYLPMTAISLRALSRYHSGVRDWPLP